MQNFKHLYLKSCTQCLVRHNALCDEPLTVEQIESLRSGQFSLSPGTHLYAQGAQLTETYTLCSGWVLLYRDLHDGKRQVVQIALPGDFVGCQPSIKTPISHTALALTNCTFCAFPHPEEIAKTVPDLAMRFASLYAQRMLSRENYLTYVAQRHAHVCLAYLLLDLYNRLRQRGLNHENTIPFPLTQEMIGQVLGLTSVHVSRVLRQWRTQGLIEIKKHRLKILDYQALYRLAESEDMPPYDEEP